MTERGPRPPRRRVSPITLRILSVNIVALVVLVAGTLTVAEYRDGLIANQTDTLAIQAQLMARGLSAEIDRDAAAVGELVLPPSSLRALRLMAEQTNARARVYDRQGRLVADSRRITGSGTAVVWSGQLPPPQSTVERHGRIVDGVFARLIDMLSTRPTPPAYHDRAITSAEDYPEVQTALTGHLATEVRRVPVMALALTDLDHLERAGDLVICAAAPFGRTDVLGAVFLTRNSIEVDQAAWRARYDALRIFAITLVLAIVLSLYLAGTIARPLRQLAAAADIVRRTRNLDHPIPEFRDRDDEIGQLSTALRDMTDGLRLRIDAIERFASDVTHEIRNPLSSIRSALETAKRVEDPAQRTRLLAIIETDIRRLDRLIRDISDASRLDRELSRQQAEPVDMGAMLAMLVEVTLATAEEKAVALDLAAEDEDLTVTGLEDRLVQVFRNLLANALSFSPAGGGIRLSATREGRAVVVRIDDEGPGVPPGKEEKIFSRFYSERPRDENFGEHSGLGLSISKQIVEAHFGSIHAENRKHPDGRVAGARFVVRLPGA